MKIVSSFVLFIFLSCNPTDKKVNISDAGTKKMDKVSEVIRSEKSSLLDSIYQGCLLFEEKNIDSFSNYHNFNKDNKSILAKYSVILNYDTIVYELKVKDVAGLYNEDKFEPSNEYVYLGSTLSLNKTVFDLKKLNYENEDTEIAPVNVWYGPTFGIAGKYYDLNDREVFLIRGINYECNGSNCMNFTLFILQKSKTGSDVSMNIVDFPGEYPYTFENVFLFKTIENTVPTINIIKKGTNGNRISEYIRFPLVLPGQTGIK